MERWQAYFERHQALGPAWLKPAVEHWRFHEILYGTILRFCPPPARLLDVGCGPGWSALYLAALGYEVIGIDRSPAVLAHARSIGERVGSAVRFLAGDAFDLGRFHGACDLVFSCGVLEHFAREVTIDLVREQARCATYVLLQVPSRYTAYTGTITDERIYSVRQLRGLVEEAGLRVVTSIGYGDVTARPWQRWLYRVLPHALWRLLQNAGFAYSIAVLGEKRR